MSNYYPDQRSLVRKLKAFGNLNLAITPFEKIVNIINKEFLLPVTIAAVHPGQYIERIRINDTAEVFTCKDDISYIKDPTKIKTFGRANSPGRSMFYGSVVSSGVNVPRISALIETERALQGADKGTSNKKVMMTVGKWKVMKNLLLSELVFHKEAAQHCEDVKKACQHQYTALAMGNSEFHLKQLIAILEFYSEQFAKPVNKETDYKISAAFSEVVCKMPDLQGLIYPSVQTKYAGTNVALTPEAVDTCLELEEVLIVSADIRNTKVFLNNHFRTGLLKPDQTTFGYVEAESISRELVEEYFLGNTDVFKSLNK